MSIPRDMQGVFREVYDDINKSLRVDVGSTTGGVTLTVSDIQIGAVEVKDHTTDDRVHVTPDNKQYVRAIDLEALVNLIKDTDGIKKITDDVNVNLQDGVGTDLTSTLTGPGVQALDVNVVAGIASLPLVIDNATSDILVYGQDNTTANRALRTDSIGRLEVVSAGTAITRIEETDTVTGVDMAFTSAAEITNYDMVFIAVARTGGSEIFSLEVSIKRGAVLHQVFKSASFQNFVTITDPIKLTAGEVLVATTSGVTASTVDLTLIKEL